MSHSRSSCRTWHRRRRTAHPSTKTDGRSAGDDTLPLPARQLMRVAAAESIQAHQGKQFCHTLFDIRPVPLLI